EAAAGDAARFVAASHEDPTEMLRERLRRGDTAVLGDPGPAPAIPPEVHEELVLTFLARHYRDWVDHPLPALGGATPREAAGRPQLVTQLVSLVRGIEGMYQGALRDGQPAYDPSWMWEELGLPEVRPPAPHVAAHDRLDAAHPGLGVLTRQVAHRLRQQPGFDERTHRCRPGDLEQDLDAARFLAEQEVARSYLPWLVDFELHRRKTFSVDRALAWMLLHTTLDVAASDVRLPFASFALTFTDRAVLSLAERLVASTRRHSPVAGHFARVVTVFVSGDTHGLELRIAVDPLGSDPPVILEHSVPLVAERLRGIDPEGTPPPLAGLVHAVVSAVLYATSAGAPAEHRPSSAEPGRTGSAPAHPSDEIFHLPGTIDLSRLRQLQTLERVPSGRQMLHRFLVRGHWRRPGKAAKDQRLRWIEPYWKGPELAAIIEKAYRLMP
nr:hypothetical protein [Deltaproteobacteria bacterium]